MNVRNLEQIQEQDSAPRRSRIGAILLFAGACAAVVTSSAMMIKRKGPAAVSTADPLAALVSSARSATPADKLEGRDVTFPSVLSDSERTTTALAAVKDERGRLVPRVEAPQPENPPAPAERLPVVPLPVGALLGETPVTAAPKDRLTALASDALRSGESQSLAPAGMDGGFQLQVASFKEQAEADKLVEELRRRGHRAFRQAAYVSERGLWHRVRVGPFKSRLEAQKYKAEFEKNERLSPFLVDPEKVKQAEAMRAARLAAQDKRGSRRPVPGE
ncbi:MAG TPA: SPOR domain-containing protein [Polyangiaceae bacterium]|nr:SPOR domain-containing protein [Polyangiaceae bacterium]